MNLKPLLILLLAAPLMAQTPAATAPPATEPQLSALEKGGLAMIAQEYQKVLNDLSQANIDIAKAHPGYQLDPQNPLGGKLVKAVPPAKPAPAAKAPEKPAEKPAEPEKK